MPDLAKVQWRVGTKVGRTIYAVLHDAEYPYDDCDDESKLKDVLIGVMDTPELAAEVVYAHNMRILLDTHL
jgi:hypothetical protein